jgi:tight adherence protein B
MNSPALLAAIGIVILLAVAWASAVVAERRRRGLRGRLAAVVGVSSLGGAAPESASLRRTTISRRRGLPAVLAGLTHWLVVELRATGDRLTIGSLMIAAAVGALLVSAVAVAILGLPLLVTAPLAVAAALWAAIVRLRFAQRRFQRRFVDAFPDALDVIVRAARAGLPVLDAMESAVTMVSEPVASEFHKLLDEMRIGIDLDEALESASDRIRVNDFRFFAAAIVLQRRTGGSLAETLANLSGLIRKRKEIRLKVRALSAETRATAYLLGVLPAAVGGFMYTLHPATMSLLFTDRRGKIILGIAVVLMLSGFMLMAALIRRTLRS